MKFKKIVFVTLVFVHVLSASYANSIPTCQSAYKNCISDIVDLLEPYADVYEVNPKKCKSNLNEWKRIDYQFVHCQDKYNKCNGKQNDLWKKIHSTPDISLELGKPEIHGLTESDIVEIQKAATNIPNLRSLLVSHEGKLIFEEYYSFKEQPKPHAMNSVTKSVMSILTGIAIDQEYLESEDVLIKPFFLNYYNQPHDVRKDLISVRHLLTMSTGINFVDQTSYLRDFKQGIEWWRDDNGRDWILEKEMLLDYKPGDTMLYGSPNIDLLAAVIASTTGQSILDFAYQHLFKPLGIENYLWIHDSKENYYGGFSLYLRPRAMTRIGQMILNDGKFKEEQIVSKEWLDKSLSSHIPLGGEEGWEYGYLWWRARVHGYQTISAMGWAGQLITLVPELDLVVTTTSDSVICSYQEQDDQFWSVFNLVKQVIKDIDK